MARQEIKGDRARTSAASDLQRSVTAGNAATNEKGQLIAGLLS
jgi:hypothetical protein